MALSVNEGTQVDVYSVANAGTEIPIVKLDIGAGTAISDFGGTLPVVTTVANVTNGTVRISVGTVTTGTLQNLVSGTINALASGTITGGTLQNLNAGTITSIANIVGGTIQHSSLPVQLGTPIHTRGTTGAAVWGTIVATAGAGTKQYVSNVDVVVTSGTVDVAVTNIGVGGSTGAGVLTRGQFTPGGGIAKNFDPIAKIG